MEDLIKNLVNARSVCPPDAVLNKLSSIFDDVVNIEWCKKNDTYEAIFYSKSIEHIARFNKKGNLIDYRINLAVNGLPPHLVKAGGDKEIMNVVEIHEESKILYELIVRDKQLIRYVRLCTKEGELISENVL